AHCSGARGTRERVRLDAHPRGVDPRRRPRQRRHLPALPARARRRAPRRRRTHLASQARGPAARARAHRPCPARAGGDRGRRPSGPWSRGRPRPVGDGSWRGRTARARGRRRGPGAALLAVSAPRALPGATEVQDGAVHEGTTPGATPPLDLAHHTGFLVRRTQQAHLAAWAREVGAGLTNVQFGVLNVLARLGEASQRELGDALDLDRSTVAGLVARLESRGLVERGRAPADRRRNAVRLSPEGRDTLARHADAAVRVDTALTASLSDAERATLQQLLTKVLDATAPRGSDTPGTTRS